MVVSKLNDLGIFTVDLLLTIITELILLKTDLDNIQILGYTFITSIILLLILPNICFITKKELAPKSSKTKD